MSDVQRDGVGTAYSEPKQSNKNEGDHTALVTTRGKQPESFSCQQLQQRGRLQSCGMDSVAAYLTAFLSSRA